MAIHSEIPEELPGDEHTRMLVRELDITNTQVRPQFAEGNDHAEEDAAELILEVDNFLEKENGELTSRLELNSLLQKLNTAIAINNEPYARELRQRLLERYD